MKILVRAGLCLATTVLAAATTMGAMSTANADGPNTEPAVVKAIKSQPWQKLGPGDSDYRIASMGCYLKQFKFYNKCNATPAGEDWPSDFTNAVKKYQKARNLPQTGELDVETWAALAIDNGEVGIGSSRTHQIKGIQYAMKVLQSSSLKVDGNYGKDTAAAVKAFQKRKKIDPDGIFGPITFRAAFAEGAESARTPGH
ncbi:MAG: peptidoglycan-binding domain-containing protein [Spirillospora sp.]